MKILHTSDWHLGKKIEGKDRISEQQEVLNEICEIVIKNNVDVVLICGDIFDTYTPSAQAEDLFYDCVTNLSQGGKRLVVVIAGNHDDPVRLCAASVLAQKTAIVISGGGQENFTFPSHCGVKILESGKGYIKININGEEAVINYLSYPSDARLSEIADNTQYTEKIKNYLYNGNQFFLSTTINLTLSHLFVAGAKPLGDEREIEAGGLKACAKSAFSPKCHYVALGHIHRHQKLNDNMFYSGSILQYSVDESEQKSVILFDVSFNGIKNIEKINICSGKKIKKYVCNNVIEAIDYLKNCNDYVYIIIQQNKPLLYNEIKELKTYKNLLNIELEITEKNNLEKTLSRKKYTDRELFDAYYEHIYNSKPKNELVNLYLDILNNEIN